MSSSTSSSGMRAALWALLAVSGAQAGCESVRFIDSRSAPCVLSLSGGGTIAPGEEGQIDRNIKLAAQPLPSSERRSRTAAAWCVPWLARRRRQARGKGADDPRGRAAVPAADPAGKMTPEAAFSSALASFVGAMIVSGGTLGMWPQSVAASPFDPRPPPNSVRQPFFEGWFIRYDVNMFISYGIGFHDFTDCLYSRAYAAACRSCCCCYCCATVSFVTELQLSVCIAMTSSNGQHGLSLLKAFDGSYVDSRYESYAMVMIEARG